MKDVMKQFVVLRVNILFENVRAEEYFIQLFVVKAVEFHTVSLNKAFQLAVGYVYRNTKLTEPVHPAFYLVAQIFSVGLEIRYYRSALVNKGISVLGFLFYKLPCAHFRGGRIVFLGVVSLCGVLFYKRGNLLNIKSTVSRYAARCSGVMFR